MKQETQIQGIKEGILCDEDSKSKLPKTAKKILIVEDEIIIAEGLQRKLETMGYNVLAIVSSGEEAIKKIKTNSPDLILMDIVIHGKMDGIETAGQIHSLFDIPVVYLTAYADEKTLERAKITEPFGYLIKPFKERELQITIEIALYKHEMEKKLKDGEKRLQEKNQWLVAVIKGIGDSVIATDPEGTIKLMNPIAEAMTGWDQKEALGTNLTTVFNIISEENDKKTEDPVTKTIREDMFYGLADRTVLITKQGMKIPVDIIGSAIKDERDNIIGVVLVFYESLNGKELIKYRNHL